MQQRYIFTPFGKNGTIIEIPIATDPTGLVSYNQGWTTDYELDLATDPAAKAVDVGSSNGVLYDITYALQNLQQYGTPEFIDTADNQGTAFAYDIYAICRYSSTGTAPFVPYLSLVTNNTAVPAEGVSWSRIASMKDVNTKAALAGSAAQNFSAEILLTSTVENTAGPLYLSSNNYTTSVNNANTALVQHYCANPIAAQAAVTLSYAQANFASINGNIGDEFAASGFTTPTGLVGTGSFLPLLNATCTASMNLNETAYVQHYCAPATVTQGAVTLGQLVKYGGQSTVGAGTSVSTSISFVATQKCIVSLDGNCGGTSVINGCGITQTGGSTLFYNTNFSNSSGVGVFSALIEVEAGATLDVTFEANYSSYGSNLNIGFKYVATPIP